MTNQELEAIRLLESQRLGIQIQKFYQIIEASNKTELQEMKTYLLVMMMSKSKDELFLPVLNQMNIMIESKLNVGS